MTTRHKYYLTAAAVITIISASYYLAPSPARLDADERDPAAPGRTAAKIDLLTDQRVLAGVGATIDLAPFKAKFGDLKYSVAVAGRDDFPIAVSPDNKRLTVSPVASHIGVHTVTVIGENAATRIEDDFRLFVSPRRFSEISPNVLDTALIDLPVRTITLGGLSPNIWNERGSLSTLGNKILISDSADQFFELDLDADRVSMKLIKLGISSNTFVLNEFIQTQTFWGKAMTFIADSLFIDGGKRLAVSYSYWHPEDKCITLRVDVTDVPADWARFANGRWTRIFESKPCLPLNDDFANIAAHQAGGRMLETRPGKVLLTVGDWGKDIYPQRRDNDYGKLLEIATTCCDRRIVTVGHRNMSGLAVDRSGRVLVTEHGPRGGDELNVITEGGDYGWPAVTYGVNYNAKTYGGHTVAGRHEGYVKPLYAWVPSPAIGNMMLVRGFSPEWEGDLLVNSLKAQQVRRLRIEGDRVVYDEPIPMGARLRDSGQLADGRIVVLTDDGRLFVLSPTSHPDATSFVKAEAARLSAAAQSQLATCQQCHSVAPGLADTTDRLNIANIVGRRIAASPVFNYSPALKAKAGTWDQRSLDAFLRAPGEFAPDTLMAFPGVPEKPVRDELIGFLEHVGAAAGDFVQPADVMR